MYNICVAVVAYILFGFFLTYLLEYVKNFVFLIFLVMWEYMGFSLVVIVSRFDNVVNRGWIEAVQFTTGSLLLGQLMAFLVWKVITRNCPNVNEANSE